MEAIVINMPITSRYKDVIEAVRSNRLFGMSHEEAVEHAFLEHWYLFAMNPDDESVLRSWFNGQFAA